MNPHVFPPSRAKPDIDAATERALQAVEQAVTAVRPLDVGPVALAAEYLLAIHASESLPQNQSGADKTWLWESVERDRRRFARAVQR